MSIKAITISTDRNDKPSYATVTLMSNYEALAFLGEGEQTVTCGDTILRVKPIAPGADKGSVCCRIVS